MTVLIGSAMLDGEKTKSISFVLDLTERKAAEGALTRLRQDREANARFRELIESAPDAMVVVGADGVVGTVNAQFERLFGYTRDEIIGRPIEVLLPERFRGGHPAKRMEYGRAPSARTIGEKMDLYGMRKDGTEFPIEVSLSPLGIEGAGLVSSAIRDISERKRNEAERSHLAAIVDSSDDAIVGITVGGIVTSWNRGAERTFGYRADEILGASISVLVPVERASEEVSILLDVASGHTQHLETLRRTKDGRIIDVALTLSPVHDFRGRVIGISGVARDVSEQKRYELAVVESRDIAVAMNLELETFSYSVAHDLRSPLRGMSGFAELLLATYADKLDAEGRVWLQQISTGAQKMGMLIDALLSLSRVARADVRRETVDLSAIVRGIASRLATGEPGIDTELVVQVGISAQMDARLALSLFENLLGNAFKFTGKHARRRIEFGTMARDGVEVLFVRDDGAGFDMAFAEKLFAPFQRLHTVREFPGTGVGLATVQRIVRRHGGEIWAEGAIDHGATFFFTVSPRDAGEVRLTAPPP